MFTTHLLRRLPLSILTLVAVAAAQPKPRPRIIGRIDDDSVTRLRETTHPLLARAADLGRAAAKLSMERMLLQLSATPEQEVALNHLLAEQQDLASPRYNQWLTPQQFGEQFGVAQQDIDTLTHWLESQGFHVEDVPAGRRTIEFSGDVNRVEQAFHTEIHRYSVGGETHIANASDIAIPSALTPVVIGIVKLNDFHAEALHRLRQSLPLANLSGGAHALSPYDLATIYNVTPLWNTGFDGAGQSIA